MARFIPTSEVGFDSLNNALPAGFDSYQQTLAYGAYGVTSITATGQGGTYVQTMSYDGSGNLTGISKWVKQ